MLTDGQFRNKRTSVFPTKILRQIQKNCFTILMIYCDPKWLFWKCWQSYHLHTTAACAGEKKKDYGHSDLYQSSPKLLFDSNHDNMMHRIYKKSINMLTFAILCDCGIKMSHLYYKFT